MTKHARRKGRRRSATPAFTHRYALAVKGSPKTNPTLAANPAKLHTLHPVTKDLNKALIWKDRAGAWRYLKQRPTLARRFKSTRIA